MLHGWPVLFVEEVGCLVCPTYPGGPVVDHLWGKQWQRGQQQPPRNGHRLHTPVAAIHEALGGGVKFG